MRNLIISRLLDSLFFRTRLFFCVAVYSSVGKSDAMVVPKLLVVRIEAKENSVYAIG